MPHKYISGDAIYLSLKALKHTPPKGTHIYDVLSSRLSESSLWRTLWKPPKNTFEHRINKIVLPINVHDIHWYIAIVSITQTKCIIDIQNNLNMRNKEAEQKLKRIGIKYREKIWDLHNQTLTQENRITPMKKPNYTPTVSIRKQGKSATTLNRPRPSNNFNSRCLNYKLSNTNNSISKENKETTPKCCSYSGEHINFLDNSDIVGQDNQAQIQMQEKNTHQGKEKQLSRPRQQKTNSRCLTFNDSDLVSSHFDSVEEVIYSQGELYPEEPFDRSWDSEDDSKFNEDYILPSGRI